MSEETRDEFAKDSALPLAVQNMSAEELMVWRALQKVKLKNLKQQAELVRLFEGLHVAMEARMVHLEERVQALETARHNQLPS